MSLYKPKAVYAASERQYTAASGEVHGPRSSTPLDGRWSEEIDTRIGKAIALWSRNGSFQTPQSC